LQRRVGDWEEIGKVIVLGLWRASLTVEASCMPRRLVIIAQSPGAMAAPHVLLNNVAVILLSSSSRNVCEDPCFAA
jgi:hypothetical protein